MSELIGNVQRRERRATAANWASDNPTPLSGEWCQETDTLRGKWGDGITSYNSLTYSIIPDIDTEIDSKLTGSTDQICKAWVNFNGTGVVAIKDSFNVSSITDNGSGNYDINYISNMTNENYSVTGGGNGATTSNPSVYLRSAGASGNPTLKTVSATGIYVGNTSGLFDNADISIQIFGT